MNCFEAKDGEDDRAGVDGGEGVAGGDDDHVLDAVLRRVVVAAEADDGAESEAEGVKDLGGCVVRLGREDFQLGKLLSGLHHLGASFIMWNLICSVKPNCGQQQFVQLGGEHVSEALGGPVQRDPAEEEDREHEVGEEGSEVNHLVVKGLILCLRSE